MAKAKKKTEGPDLSAAPLEELLRVLGIHDWSAFVIGDGSGSNWSIGAGWASIVIERHYPNDRRVLWGARSSGTVNIAELSAYTDALEWYVYNCKDRVGSGRMRHVHILSDSKLTVDQGNGRIGAGSQAPRWAFVNELRRQHHLMLSWHWLDRDTTALNKLADFVSREARLALAAADPQTLIPGFDPGKLNPHSSGEIQ